jgi:hypothetical protein
MISKASKIRAESMADRRACRSRLTGLALSEAKNNRATRNVLFKTKAILQASRRSAELLVERNASYRRKKNGPALRIA